MNNHLRRIRRVIVGGFAALALAVPATAVVAQDADAASYRYDNCSQLNRTFKHGVGKKKAHDKVRGHSKPVTSFKRSTKIYKKAVAYNSDLDRDGDGVACERR